MPQRLQTLSGVPLEMTDKRKKPSAEGRRRVRLTHGGSNAGQGEFYQGRVDVAPGGPNDRGDGRHGGGS